MPRSPSLEKDYLHQAAHIAKLKIHLRYWLYIFAACTLSLGFFFFLPIEIPDNSFSQPLFYSLIEINGELEINIDTEYSKFSSVKYFLVVDPEKINWNDFLEVSVNCDEANLEEYRRVFLVARFVASDALRLPLGNIRKAACQGGSTILVRTNAPEGAIGIWMASDMLDVNETERSSDFSSVLNVRNSIFKVLRTSYDRQRLYEIASITILVFSLGFTLYALFRRSFTIDNKALQNMFPLGVFILLMLGFIFITYSWDGQRLPQLLNLPTLLMPLLYGMYTTIRLHRQAESNADDICLHGVLLWALSWIIVLILTSSHLVPPWVDGINHLEIVRALKAQTRSPYLNGYHIGFHLITIVIEKVLGINDVQAFLYIGMLSASMVAPMVYLFTRELTDDDYPAVLAGVLVAAISPLPLYLLNWARYPFLLSLVLDLLIFRSLFKHFLKHGRISLPVFTFTVATAGLIHYSSIYLVVIFLAACLIYRFLRRRDHGPASSNQKTDLFIVFMIILVFIIISISVVGGFGLQNLSMLREAGQENLFHIIGLAFRGTGWVIIALACIYIINMFVSKTIQFHVITFFITLLLLGQLLQYLVFGAFFFSWINTINVLMIMFCVLSALFINRLMAKVIPKEKTTSILLKTLPLFIGLIGMMISPYLMQSSNVKFGKSDLAAIDWIKDNNIEGTFLINFMLWDGQIVPSDGGGWLVYLTENRSIEPLYSTTPQEICNWLERSQPDYFYDGGGIKNVDYYQLDCISFDPKYKDEVIIFNIE